MQIILYSNNCPLCKGLEKALQNKKIKYEKCVDSNTMKELNIKRTPMLLVEDKLLSNKDALKWVLSQE